MGSTAVSGTDPLAAGHVALRNAAWDEARARFEEAVDTGDAPEAWEGLSRAAWWQGDQEETLAARERAFRAYRDVGDAFGAARMAMWLACDIDDVGVEVVALALLGSALVASGAVEEGLRRLDECAALAVGEEFTETAAPGFTRLPAIAFVNASTSFITAFASSAASGT